jgi:hypothetical protein
MLGKVLHGALPLKVNTYCKGRNQQPSSLFWLQSMYTCCMPTPYFYAVGNTSRRSVELASICSQSCQTVYAMLLSWQHAHTHIASWGRRNKHTVRQKHWCCWLDAVRYCAHLHCDCCLGGPHAPLLHPWQHWLLFVASDHWALLHSSGGLRCVLGDTCEQVLKYCRWMLLQKARLRL